MNLLSRIWRGIQWLFPATLLVLMPKCPICVAAYVALCTGIGISAATARFIQILMLVLCLASLAYLAGRLLLNVSLNLKTPAPGESPLLYPAPCSQSPEEPVRAGS
jgi:hypothetical protein